jgi:hypothetical protein
VLTLLAVAAGYPALVDRLLVALQGENDIPGWPEFVRELSPASGDRPAGRLVPADLTDASLDAAKLATWTNLCTGLDASLAATTLIDLEPHRRWGRIAARFSFTL